MIRLSWRQFRVQAAVAAAGLVIVAIVVAITGPHLSDLYNTTVAHCKAQGDCQAATNALVDTDRFLQNALDVVLFVAPALIGIFWGAPLVARELETATFRLAWTQSITRKRWLAAKLGVVGLSSVAVTALLSLMVTVWFAPIDRGNANQYTSTVFDARNLAPIGYAAFAFALGVTAGVLIRRTVPAMAATLAGFVAVRLAITHWIRPHLIAPAHTELALRAAGNIGFQGSPTTFFAVDPTVPNAWTISSQIVDRAGHAATAPTLQAFVARVCPNIGAPLASGGARPPSPGTFQACVSHLSASFHLAVSYQPASRYWSFQWLELAVYAAIALILTGICFWSVHRRLS